MMAGDVWKNGKVMPGRPELMGATVTDGGVNFSVEVTREKDVKLLLYRKGGHIPAREIDMTAGARVGNVYSVFVSALPAGETEYNFKIGARVVTDPYAKKIAGRKRWGAPPEEKDGHGVRGAFPCAQYDWEGDSPLMLPYGEVIAYALHVRGFTKHSSSGVRHKGTFLGIKEKIPYLTELGVNQLVLQPAYEFDETGGEHEKTNYWGYAPGFYFAPKNAYAAGDDAAREFKDMVKALHKAGIELIMEFYFPEGTDRLLMLECLRYWLLEYHADGFYLNGPSAPMELFAKDPLLASCKLMSAGFDMRGLYKDLPVFCNVGECNDGFQNDARRFLKGDEGMAEAFAWRARRNPPDRGIVNYITNHNGFTLADLVSYEARHNEANGEQNRDGSSQNYSWNCGAEGPSRRKAVLALRQKQIRNALVMLLLSQGTPLILSGDELGHTQKGNNNAYCQDNDISWLNYRVPKGSRFIFDFVKALIALRKRHPILHMPREMRIMDSLSCGYPDLSYHGEKAWYPEFESCSRRFGVMYCGRYAGEDDFFYFACNMHWLPHEFALPSLPKGMSWRTVVDTSKEEETVALEERAKPLEEQKKVTVPERTIFVLIGRKSDGGK